MSARWGAVISLGAVTPLGFAFKLFEGPGRWWFNDYGAGVWYVVFWMLVVFCWRPRRVGRIGAGVLAATCGLEFLQLWPPAFLEEVRASFLGRVLIGATFSWWDLPHYVLGALIGYGLLKWLQGDKRQGRTVGLGRRGALGLLGGAALGAGGWALWHVLTGRRWPALVFNWHGYRAGLDERGGGGPAVGLEDLVAAGVTHVGVPQDHSGDFGHRHYIAQIEARGIRIVRTIERRFNAGLGRDLGGILLDWRGPEEPGVFFDDFVAHLEAPCHGIGWNLEHDVLNEAHYPLTTADRAVAAEWDLAVEDRAGAPYVAFRCRQFALLFQLYFEAARRRHPACQLAIGYSGYAGARYRRLGLEAAYGCDWGLLGKGHKWRGHRLRPITHAMCAWHQSVDLPPEAWPPPHDLPVIHTLQLAPSLAGAANFRRRLEWLAQRCRPGDGLGTVEHGKRPVWDEGDQLVQRLLGEVNSLYLK